MYKIKINNMKFFSHIGVLPEEKMIGQNLEIDLIITTNFSFSGLDQLNETISYVGFYETVAKIVEESRADLIEKLAFDIIQEIKMNEKVKAVEVHIRKMAVPISGIFDSIEVEVVN